MTSRLATAQSAYLRSAAHQPVQWYPWGPEPFERARAEKKPVLLDIGAVWCHWCHVMDGESYENPAIAELLNRDWICVKVDRDERPDVDARYQRAVQALTQQGGWPLTAFLTADGDVFYGGTYFPPDARHGRAGFAQVLAELARMHREQPDRVSGQAAEVRKFIAERSAESHAGATSPEILSQGADAMAQAFDFRNGGFGSQPKFPHPAACDFLLTRWFDRRDRWAKEIVDRTLSAMANGGVYDHVGGGFHRYSVDARWIVPHFEKMSYDNSELLRAYVHAAGTEPVPPRTAPYRPVVQGIVDWVTEVMSDPAGGYFASQDADVGLEDDGDYFTWSVDEARAALSPDEFAALAPCYGIDEAGDMHDRPGRNVLNTKSAPERVDDALIASGRAKLKKARDQRPMPFVDRTLYTGWNAMMASAMLEASAYLDAPAIERHALLTLERIFAEAADGPAVRHSVGGVVQGILEDQVQTAVACLDAFEATGAATWLDRATGLMEHVWTGYRAEDGGLTDTATNRGGEGFLNQPLRPVQDAPTPSPNGVAGIALVRLAEHTGDAKWRERGGDLLKAFAGGAAQLGLYGTTLLRALDWYLNPAAHVVVVGNPNDPAVAAMRRVARTTYRPRKVITLLTASTHDARLPTHLRAMMDGKAPRAYVCAGLQCGPPADSPDALAHTIATFR